MDPLLEIAYALQVAYDPDRPNLDDIRKAIDQLSIDAKTKDRKAWEHEIREHCRRHRLVQCHEHITIITRKDIDLMSEAQLVYLPEHLKSTTVYYPLDAVTDVDALLMLKKHPFTNQDLTVEQIKFLKNINHKYPRIAVGDFFEELDERLCCNQVKYIEKEYQKKMRELSSLIEAVNLKYQSDQIYNFATEYVLEQYNLFLRHKPLNQKLPECDRNTASAMTLNHILNYINLQKNDHQKISIVHMAHAIDEFIYLIRNNLTYDELLRDRGIANELYWKPNFLVETFYGNDNLKCQYYVDEKNNYRGDYKMWYANGNLAYISTWNHDIESNIVQYYGTGERAREANIYYYPNGNFLAVPKNGKYEVFDELGQSLGLFEKNGFEFKNNSRILIKWALYNNLIWQLNNFYNDQNHGLYICWSRNGNLHTKTFYKNNKLDGQYQQYHTNSNLWYQGNYQDGKKIGIWTEYHENKILKQYECYDEGNLIGLQQTWHDTGHLASETFYYDGKKMGLCQKWYDNDVLYTEGMYSYNKQIGVWKSWFTNGVLQNISVYENGMLHGPSMVWYSNGQLKTKLCYEYGKKLGFEDYYHENGILLHEMFYIKDKKYGIASTWNRQGLLTEQGFWNNNLRVGICQYWDPENHHTEYGLYHDGKRSGVWRSKMGNFIYLYESYINGNLNGLISKSYPNGQLYFQGDYIIDNPKGPWKYYYPNGQLAASGNFTYTDPRFSIWDPQGTYIGERFIELSGGIRFHTEDKKYEGLYTTNDGNGKITVKYYRDGECVGSTTRWYWEDDILKCEN